LRRRANLTRAFLRPPVTGLFTVLVQGWRVKSARTEIQVEEYQSMKSHESVIRLKRFQVDEKRQQASDIEAMIADFERMAADLDQQIEAEQKRTGISDAKHFAYSTFAKAAMQRRDNLRASVDELNAKLEAARDALEEAFEELKKVELMEEREMERGHELAAARGQAALGVAGVALQRRR
jgi:flagellar export protein FliJ